MALVYTPQAYVPRGTQQSAAPSAKAVPRKQPFVQPEFAPVEVPGIELTPQQKYFRRAYQVAVDDVEEFKAFMDTKYGEERKGYLEKIPDSPERLLMEELARRPVTLRKIACRANEPELKENPLLPRSFCAGLPSITEEMFPKATVGVKHFGKGNQPSFHLAD
jgi:hypothetical protein